MSISVIVINNSKCDDLHRRPFEHATVLDTMPFHSWVMNESQGNRQCYWDETNQTHGIHNDTYWHYIIYI